jgi:GTP-binding protein
MLHHADEQMPDSRLPNPFAAVHFTLSCAQLQQLPPPELPEVAFAGRSNAGKSSALNALAGSKQIARVSKTPGRTQLINYFEVDGVGRLVDLPGYGYAAVPVEIRRGWGRLVGGYLETRENLRGVVLVMDIRHPMTELDQQMLAWTQSYGRSCHVLLTKSDKLGFGAAKNQLQKVRSELKQLAQPPSVQLYSSETKSGVDEAREVVKNWFTATT